MHSALRGLVIRNGVTLFASQVFSPLSFITSQLKAMSDRISAMRIISPSEYEELFTAKLAQTDIAIMGCGILDKEGNVMII